MPNDFEDTVADFADTEIEDSEQKEYACGSCGYSTDDPFEFAGNDDFGWECPKCGQGG